MPSPVRATLALFALAVSLGSGAASAQAATERLMIVGDSISQGSAGDFTWRARLWQSLQASPAAGTVDFIGSRRGLFNYAAGLQDGGTAYADPNFDQDHEALWGQKLATVASSIGSTLAAAPLKPTVLVVELGTNDVAAGASTTINNMRRLITAARQQAPGVDVLLLDPYPFWSKQYATYTNRDFTSALASGYASLASQLSTTAERVAVAPTSSFDARSMTWDGRHPDPNGELVLASTVARGLAAFGIGDGPHLPATASWPATAAAPRLAVSGGRVTATWRDETPGALGYGLDVRRVSVTAGLGPWTRATQGPKTLVSWTSGVLAAGDVYQFRVVPLRNSMVGVPSPAVAVKIPGGTATTAATR